jgi:hypothetical protein
VLNGLHGDCVASVLQHHWASGCRVRESKTVQSHHRARVQSHHYSDEMARKSELEEYLPKCLSWHRIERFDEIDESHVGFQVVFLSLPQRIDDCKSSIDGTAVHNHQATSSTISASPAASATVRLHVPTTTVMRQKPLRPLVSKHRRIITLTSSRPPKAKRYSGGASMSARGR